MTEPSGAFRVLGYGSLLDPAYVRDVCGESHVHAFGRGWLHGLRRHWRLVYRNGCWDEGEYVHADSGSPFRGGIAFLGLREEPGAEMPVSEILVDSHALATIDLEEYLYRRVDVRDRYLTSQERRAPRAPVWLYRDFPGDYPEGRYEGPTVVVTREYAERIAVAASELLPGGVDHFERTTDPCPWPVADLVWRSHAVDVDLDDDGEFPI